MREKKKSTYVGIRTHIAVYIVVNYIHVEVYIVVHIAHLYTLLYVLCIVVVIYSYV